MIQTTYVEGFHLFLEGEFSSKAHLGSCAVSSKGCRNPSLVPMCGVGSISARRLFCALESLLLLWVRVSLIRVLHAAPSSAARCGESSPSCLEPPQPRAGSEGWSRTGQGPGMEEVVEVHQCCHWILSWKAVLWCLGVGGLSLWDQGVLCPGSGRWHLSEPRLLQLLHPREAHRHPRGWRREAGSSGRGAPGAGRARQKRSRCPGSPRGGMPAGRGCQGCREDGAGAEPGARRHRGLAHLGAGGGRRPAAGRGAGPGPLPRCTLSGAGGEPQTKSRGRSRAGTGARRGRPGGRGRGGGGGQRHRGAEPGSGAAGEPGLLRSPGTKGSCCPPRAPWPGAPQHHAPQGARLRLGGPADPLQPERSPAPGEAVSTGRRRRSRNRRRAGTLSGSLPVKGGGEGGDDTHIHDPFCSAMGSGGGCTSRLTKPARSALEGLGSGRRAAAVPEPSSTFVLAGAKVHRAGKGEAGGRRRKPP